MARVVKRGFVFDVQNAEGHVLFTSFVEEEAQEQAEALNES